MKSILLTDTCLQRDPYLSCKSNVWCDNYAKVARDMYLGFMYTTVTAAKNLTKLLVCSDSGNLLFHIVSCIMNTSCTYAKEKKAGRVILVIKKRFMFFFSL